MDTITRVAVLDDYQKISHTQFDSLSKDVFKVTIFQDTLLPYNHPSTPEHVKSQLVERLQPFEVICTMRERTPFPGALLEKLPRLKLLLTTATRNASLDLEAAKQLGIRVAGTTAFKPGVPKGPDSTTQHAAAMILGIARNLAADDVVVKCGGWQTDFATGLTGKTLGLLGLGRLGVNVAKIMHLAFEMRIIAWSANLTQEIADEQAKKAGLPMVDENGEKVFKAVSKEELFKTADVVSVHYVLSDRSRGIVGKTDLEMMKKEALLVNTSRGPLIQEKALLNVLKEGKIKGAALDVFDLEPLPLDSDWRVTKWGVDGRSQVLLTPHMGYVEKEALQNWYEGQVENIKRWHGGQELLVPLV